MLENKSIWQWAAFAGLGVLAYTFLPGKLRFPVIIVLLLGGLVFLQKRGGLGGLIKTLETGGKE